MRTYLEFGEKNGKKGRVLYKKSGQEAYDFYMVSRYLQDIIGYRSGDLSLIAHKNDLHDNIKKHKALVTTNAKSYYELGSSLMGVIDALEYVNSFVKVKKKDQSKRN